MDAKRLSPDACIACTSCLVQCPVSAVTPDYPGPRFIGPAFERFRLLAIAEDDSLHYCSNCKNCDIACPHGVPVSTLLMRARAAQSAGRGRSLRDWALAHGEILGRWMRFIPASMRNAGMLNPVSRRLLDRLGIAGEAPLPAFASRPLRARLSSLPLARGGKPVAFFPGCYTNMYDPETGLDIIELLHKAGYAVTVPDDFVCCGLPMVAGGFWEDARANAVRNREALRRFARDGVTVITGCPSCALMLTVDIDEYFPELDMASVAGCVADAQHFLRECLERGELEPPRNARPRILAYHAPCHLRAQGQGLSGLELLRALPGCTVINADAGCCGISGSYGFKKEHYAVSMQTGADLFATLRAISAEANVSECGTCRLQMRHGSGQKSLHPATIVRQVLEGG